MYFLTENELSSVHAGFEKMKALAESTKKELSAVIQQNELLKSMISSLDLDFKQFSRSKREQNSTSAAPKSTTRHRRRKETEKALKFIQVEIQVHFTERGTILLLMLQKNWLVNLLLAIKEESISKKSLKSQ